jgi:hypothetical protein
MSGGQRLLPEIRSQLQKPIDTVFILPQYLGLASHSLPRVGLHFRISGPESTTLARENRSRRNLHGNQEEGKEEETLTRCETILARTKNLTSPSGEAPLEGLSLRVAISNW